MHCLPLKIRRFKITGKTFQRMHAMARRFLIIRIEGRCRGGLSRYQGKNAVERKGLERPFVELTYNFALEPA